MSNVTPRLFMAESEKEELLQLHSAEGLGPNGQLEVVLQPAEDN